MKAENRLRDILKLAKLNHKEFCSMDHVGCCSWHYELKGEKHQWTRHAHLNFLEKTISVVNKMNLFKDLFALAKIIDLEKNIVEVKKEQYTCSMKFMNNRDLLKNGDYILCAERLVGINEKVYVGVDIVGDEQ